MTAQELVKICEPYCYIVFTGGEPTLQQDRLLPVLTQLNLKKKRVGIESNGSVKTSESFQGLIHTYTISPKLKNSENPQGKFSPVEKATYKFVVREERDIDETQAFCHEHKIRKEQVYLMAEGFTKEKQLDAKWLFEFCMEQQYNYSPRLHVLFFGNKRYV